MLLLPTLREAWWHIIKFQLHWPTVNEAAVLLRNHYFLDHLAASGRSAGPLVFDPKCVHLLWNIKKQFTTSVRKKSLLVILREPDRTIILVKLTEYYFSIVSLIYIKNSKIQANLTLLSDYFRNMQYMICA